MKYEIIDNFLNQQDFLNIKNLMMFNNFPWYYQNDVTTVGSGSKVKEWYFTHMFYHEYSVASSYWEIIFPIIRKINPISLIRVKGNLYPNLNVPSKNLWHKDYEFSHKGAIFYVNSNNGPTVLKDGTQIFPVENRILFFDSSEMHQSSHCSDEKIRVNININYF